MSKRTILINLVIFTAILLALEVFTGYFSSSKRLLRSTLLYSIRELGQKVSNPTGSSERYKRVLSLRNNGLKNVYPAYLFDPQAHDAGTPHWFGHPPDSLIIYCNEGSGLLQFKTNPFGFRRPVTQDFSKPFDLILVGDSFTEGACVPNPFDLASLLSASHNVLNLGRGGSGPLFQLGLMTEIFQSANNHSISLSSGFNVLWIVFTGNDLQNLVEEKQSSLFRYLTDDGFSSNYFRKVVSGAVTGSMRQFHELILRSPRSNLGSHGYGETLEPHNVTEISATNDLSRTIVRMNSLVSKNGGKLSIVILANHPRYSPPIMSSTQNLFKRDCQRLKIRCLQYDLSNPENFANTRNHLTEAEYLKLSVAVQGLLDPDLSPRR